MLKLVKPKPQQAPPKIYISGPISKGNISFNIRQAIIAANELVSNNIVPYVPHMDVIWALISPIPYETCLWMDFEWIKICDGVLRLPGESRGGDREVEFAKSLRKPIYYSVTEVIEKLKGVS